MSLFGTYVAFCTERLLQHLMPRSTNETSTRLDVPNKEDKTAPAFAINSLRLAQSFPLSYRYLPFLSRHLVLSGSPLTMTLRSIMALSLLFRFLNCSQCALLNVSIDDTFGDERTGNQISYLPSNGWKFGQNCTDCTAVPERGQNFRHTWHDGSFDPQSVGGDGIIRSALVSFNGTSCPNIFCIEVVHGY